VKGTAESRVHASILAAPSYVEFRRRLEAFDCRRCGLCSGRTSLVIDRGSESARLLLVGEGPGAEEDRLGHAFVGRSGKLLDAMLASVGIDPARDVLIANVVKCRPPDNRRPTRDEALACLPFLERQIELTGPRVMGLLGATAAEHVLRTRGLKVTGLAGRFLESHPYPGIDVMVLFHPAYILRNPRKRSVMERQLRKLASGLRG
jgi:uracil-DNA glycosylase family 4